MKHPAPWLWKWTHYPYGEPKWFKLVDANGETIFRPQEEDSDGRATIPLPKLSPRVRALIEAAPNLERLREIEWRGGSVGDISCCPACGAEPFYQPDPAHPTHGPDCWIAQTLARIDDHKT